MRRICRDGVAHRFTMLLEACRAGRYPLAPKAHRGRARGENAMKTLMLAGLVTMSLAAGAAPAMAQDPSGTWLSQSGDTRVRIARCGSAYCGTIVAVRNNLKDENNPNPALRTRSLVGVQMISGLQSSGEGAWSGSLYNYTDGKTYSGKMRLVSPAALELSGYVMGVICRSQTWSRVN
jgi:uncharacterized protein (DUF2147 family)